MIQIWDHFYRLLFHQGFRLFNKFGHWTSKTGCKKMFKWSEKMRKIHDLFLPLRFYTLYEQTFSNLWPSLSITFPQGFWISKKFGHWILGNGGKKTVKRSEKVWQTDIQINKQTNIRTSCLIDWIGLGSNSGKIVFS